MQTEGWCLQHYVSQFTTCTSIFLYFYNFIEKTKYNYAQSTCYYDNKSTDFRIMIYFSKPVLINITIYRNSDSLK